MKISIRVSPRLNLDSTTKNVKNRVANGVNNMANELMRIADPLTPKKKGNLRKNRTKTLSGTTATITWRQPYAAVQEAGRRRGARPFSKYTTPGTSAHFVQKAKEQIEKRKEEFF